MKTKIKIGTISLLTISACVFGFWYLFSPQAALSGMKTAYEERDYETFSSYIDFDKLRQDLKAEIAVEASQQSQMSDNPFDKMSGLVAPAIGNGFIDALINPTSVRVAFQSAGKSNPDLKLLTLPEGELEIVRDSLGQFHILGKDGEKLVFYSAGFSWKLVGIDLPLADNLSNKQSEQIEDKENLPDLLDDSEDIESREVSRANLIGAWVVDGEDCASESPIQLKDNGTIPLFGGSLDEPIDAKWRYDGKLHIDDGKAKEKYNVTMPNINRLTIEWDKGDVYSYTRC